MRQSRLGLMNATSLAQGVWQTGAWAAIGHNQPLASDWSGVVHLRVRRQVNDRRWLVCDVLVNFTQGVRGQHARYLVA